MMKRIFATIINIISITFLGLLFYLFMGALPNGWGKIISIFQIIIFSLISFALTMFISDNFKLSNNKFIKILQNFVFINSILVLIGLILYLFDINILNTVFCSDVSDTYLKEAGNIKNTEMNINPGPCASEKDSPFLSLF